MNEKIFDLVQKHCKPCEQGTEPMKDLEIQAHLSALEAWELQSNSKNQKVITKTYRFKDYYQTMAFVNATAWISHQENHHPDLEVRYDRCRVTYLTHALGGLSENDFICAAKLDQLLSSTE